MAWAALLATVLQIIMIFWLRPRGLSTRPGFRGLSRVLRFGALTALTDVVRVGDKGAPDVVLGRAMGMAEVAFFSRATGLVDLFNRMIIEAVAYVALPHFAVKVRAGEDVAQAYLRAVTLLTGLSWPFFVWLAAVAPTVVLLLYGDQWLTSVVLVQILCAGELLLAPFQLVDQVLIAQGKIRLETVRIASMLGIRLLPLVLLTPQGLETVALGYAAANLLVVIVSMYIMRQHMGISPRELAKALVPSGGALLLAGGVVGSISFALPPDLATGWWGLGIFSVAIALATMIAHRLSRHPLLDELIRFWHSTRAWRQT